MNRVAPMPPDHSNDDGEEARRLDAEDEARLLNFYRAQGIRYRIEVTELESGDFYWHLYARSGGQRLNGGIALTREDARREACRASFSADWSEDRVPVSPF